MINIIKNLDERILNKSNKLNSSQHTFTYFEVCQLSAKYSGINFNSIDYLIAFLFLVVDELCERRALSNKPHLNAPLRASICVEACVWRQNIVPKPYCFDRGPKV